MKLWIAPCVLSLFALFGLASAFSSADSPLLQTVMAIKTGQDGTSTQPALGNGDPNAAAVQPAETTCTLSSDLPTATMEAVASGGSAPAVPAADKPAATRPTNAADPASAIAADNGPNTLPETTCQDSVGAAPTPASEATPPLALASVDNQQNNSANAVQPSSAIFNASSNVPVGDKVTLVPVVIINTGGGIQPANGSVGLAPVTGIGAAAAPQAAYGNSVPNSDAISSPDEASNSPAVVAVQAVAPSSASGVLSNAYSSPGDQAAQAVNGAAAKQNASSGITALVVDPGALDMPPMLLSLPVPVSGEALPTANAKAPATFRAGRSKRPRHRCTSRQGGSASTQSAVGVGGQQAY